MKFRCLGKYHWQSITKIIVRNKNGSRFNLETKCTTKPQSNKIINKIKRVEKRE